jgi:hypothetical protein
MSTKHEIDYCECNNLEALHRYVKILNPSVVIYNQAPVIMAWAAYAKASLPSILHLAMTHDTVQEAMDARQAAPFDFRIALDPTLKENDIWFTSVRPLFNHNGKYSDVKNETLTLGSFGFYFRHKNFDKVIEQSINLRKPVNLNLHITKAHFSSDSTKLEFDAFVNWAKTTTHGSNVNLTINQDYLSDNNLIDELSRNDLNILLYDYNYGSGPSSAIDYCVAAGRPMLLSNSHQFRHVRDRFPSIMNSGVEAAINAGSSEVFKVRDEWSPENFLRDYERIIYEVQNR